MSNQILFGDPALILLTTMIGLAILVMGRYIFWIFVTGLGFVLGFLLTSQFYTTLVEWQVLLISCLIAALGALLAVTVERLAAGIAGFATGWYLAIILLSYINLSLGRIEPLIPYIIGIICGSLLMFYFDWGVIIASSLAGSAIIVSGMNLTENFEITLLCMFALAGIAIQAVWFLQDK